MKKLFFIFLLLPLLCMTSCLKEEENLFDGSAAERIAKALTDYNRVLNGAANGWLMEYYSIDAGGYIYLCKFETLEGQLNGTVTVGSELDPDETAESLYELKSDQSAVLTFNTFNPLFHFFAEPYSGNRNGLRGDYEFTFVKVDANEIILRGKKHGDRIVMKPFGSDWKSHLETLAALQEKCSYSTYQLYDKNKLVCPVEIDGDYRWVTFSLENQTIEERFIYTTTGFKFYEPVEIGATTFQFFDWDDSKKEFRCKDPGVDAFFELDIPSDYLFYEDFIGEFTFEFQRVALSNSGPRYQRPVTVTEKVPGQTYNISGIMDGYDFEMRYNKTTGTVGIWTQAIGIYTVGTTDNTVGACVIDAGYSTYSWGSFWYRGRWNEDTENFKIIFEDSGTWSTAPVGGLYVVYTTAWPGSGTLVPGGNSVFLGIVMIKN